MSALGVKADIASSISLTVRRLVDAAIPPRTSRRQKYDDFWRELVIAWLFATLRQSVNLQRMFMKQPSISALIASCGKLISNPARSKNVNRRQAFLTRNYPALKSRLRSALGGTSKHDAFTFSCPSINYSLLKY
jgi:hypothetical protein